jgi:Asp-tRNA(Asn)/Glu-tRNA(Gln) amidotransferase A subunit family amidase
VTAERALEAASKADREMCEGRHRGLLHGVRYAVKHVYETAGLPQAAALGFKTAHFSETTPTILASRVGSIGLGVFVCAEPRASAP